MKTGCADGVEGRKSGLRADVIGAWAVWTGHRVLPAQVTDRGRGSKPNLPVHGQRGLAGNDVARKVETRWKEPTTDEGLLKKQAPGGENCLCRRN